MGVESWNIKVNFSTFSVRGCWGQPMLLFGKLVDETQMGNPRDHAFRDIASKFSIFLPLRAIYFRSERYETPCTKNLRNCTKDLKQLIDILEKDQDVNIKQTLLRKKMNHISCYKHMLCFEGHSQFLCFFGQIFTT